MIEFRRNGAEVSLFVESGLDHTSGGLTHFAFTFNCGTEYAAQLLQAHLRERFQSLVRDVRKEEYCEGWKAAKAKKSGKEEWFSSVLRRRRV